MQDVVGVLDDPEKYDRELAKSDSLVRQTYYQAWEYIKGIFQ